MVMMAICNLLLTGWRKFDRRLPKSLISTAYLHVKPETLSGYQNKISDTAGRYPYREALTADFLYIRLHGAKQLYASEYTEAELQVWAKKIREWNRDTCIYFDNDHEAHALKNAERLKQILASPPITAK
jgi:uncharacterized protein YecE (DUF72 family)